MKQGLHGHVSNSPTAKEKLKPLHLSAPPKRRKPIDAFYYIPWTDVAPVDFLSITVAHLCF